MANFTRKARAESGIAIGNSQIKQANKGKSNFGFQLSNSTRLNMTRSGASNKLHSTIEKNRAAKGLPKLRRPPQVPHPKSDTAKKRKRAAK